MQKLSHWIVQFFEILETFDFKNGSGGLLLPLEKSFL